MVLLYIHSYIHRISLLEFQRENRDLDLKINNKIKIKIIKQILMDYISYSHVLEKVLTSLLLNILKIYMIR